MKRKKIWRKRRESSKKRKRGGKEGREDIRGGGRNKLRLV